jgi:DNA-binding CsgD family transcriptional regulator
MNTTATPIAPISGLLSLVADAIEPATTETPTPVQTPALSEILGQLAGGWMAVKEDGHCWMLLQFVPNPETASTTTDTTPVEEPVTEARPVPARPDFAARARRVHTALTDREREVLCLVAGGATNRAIGRRLYISPKTASVHVSRILTKLDATTRTEAAALAHASGLVRAWELDEPTSDARTVMHMVSA